MKRNIILFIFISFITVDAFACKCKKGSVREKFNTAEQIFVGKVVNFSKDSVTLKIIRSWKGSPIISSTIKLKQEGNSCSFEVDNLNEYLLILKTEAHSFNRCSGSWNLSWGPSPIIDWLNDNKEYQDASLTGWESMLYKNTQNNKNPSVNYFYKGQDALFIYENRLLDFSQLPENRTLYGHSKYYFLLLNGENKCGVEKVYYIHSKHSLNTISRSKARRLLRKANKKCRR